MSQSRMGLSVPYVFNTDLMRLPSILYPLLSVFHANLLLLHFYPWLADDHDVN